MQFSGVSPLTTEGTGTRTVGATITDGNTSGISRTFTINSSEPLEEVLVTRNITHPYRGDVEAWLYSPAGTAGRLMMAANDSGDNINWTFSTNAFWGENPKGTWTLMVRDTYSGDVGTWNSFAVTVRMGELIPMEASGPTLNSVVSRRTHGTRGTFDLNLNLGTGTGTVEPRNTNGSLRLVFTFSEAVKAADGVLSSNEFTLTNCLYGSASVSGNTLTLNVSGVKTATVVKVALRNITGLTGAAMTGDTDVEIRVLLGDVTQNRTVNTTDQGRYGSALYATAVSTTNFWLDVNCDGIFSSTDRSVVTGQLYKTVP